MTHVYSFITSITRPTFPSCKSTLIPWGWNDDLVKRFSTIPLLSVTGYQLSVIGYR